MAICGFLWLFSCLFKSKLHWHTQETAADNEAFKSFLLWSQSRGKYNIVWDVWYYHGNPICVQSQQGHLFSIKKCKMTWGRVWEIRKLYSFIGVFYIYCACGHVDLPPAITTCTFQLSTNTPHAPSHRQQLWRWVRCANWVLIPPKLAWLLHTYAAWCLWASSL